jgi:hypothetical protein
MGAVAASDILGKVTEAVSGGQWNTMSPGEFQAISPVINTPEKEQVKIHPI